MKEMDLFRQDTDFLDVDKYCCGAHQICLYYRPKQYPRGWADPQRGICEDPALDNDRKNFNEALKKLKGKKGGRHNMEKWPNWIPNMTECPRIN